MFSKPNYTQVPNEFFDDIAKTLSDGELRVMLVIIRQTFGWKKEWDHLSASQIAEKTGFEKRSVWRILRSLLDKKLIKKIKTGPPGDEKCWYSLNAEEPEKDKIIPDNIDVEEDFKIIPTPDPGGIKIIPTPDKVVTPPLTPKSPTKETPTKETRDCLSAPPVGSEVSLKIIKKFDTGGTELAFEIDDVFKRAIQTNKDWRTSEIKEAWEILVKYTGRVNDCMAFIEGTINNLRKKSNLERIPEGKWSTKSTKQVQHTGRTPGPQLSMEELRARQSYIAALCKEMEEMKGIKEQPSQS